MRSSVRKGHFHDCVSRPGDLKCQGTGGPDGHQRDQLPGSTGALCCSLKFAWKHPQPRDLNREAGTASLKVMAGGGENRPSSTRVKIPPPLHTAVPTAAPWHQGLLTMLPVQLGMNWGRWTHSPESSALRTSVNTSPHLLNNFKYLIQSKCHMHWIYQFSIRLCILKTSPFG